MKELKSLMIVLLVVGIMATGILAFMNPFLNTYGVEEPGNMSAYKQLADMTNRTSGVEDDLKGIDSDTGGSKLTVIITRSAYTTMVEGLRSLPVMGRMFVFIADDLGIPSSVLMAVLSIIILGIVFGLALLFLQVIGR